MGLLFTEPLVFYPEDILCGNEYLENLPMVRSFSRNVFWKIDIHKMSNNMERLQIRAKSFENI